MQMKGEHMKVIVERGKCVGNARCAAVAPEVYQLDDVGYISFDEIEVPAQFAEQAKRGARACPERIIKIKEDEAS